MIKMQSKGDIFVILDNGRVVIFETSYDAWCHIFLLRGIRSRVDMGPRSLYPVRSLNPVPERRTKEKRLRIVLDDVMSSEYETNEASVPRRKAATYERTGDT